MDAREDIQGLSKPFAHRLGAMIEAGLLTYREYIPWTDSLILAMDRPPAWILALAVTKYRPEAVRVVHDFAHSEPFECLSQDSRVDEYVAALYLRYERRELSWATFLRMAGDEADANGGKHACEFFYMLLNEYEFVEFAISAEAEQVKMIRSDDGKTIASVSATFEAIRRFRLH